MSHYFLGEKDRRRVNNALNVVESGVNFPFSFEFDVADAPDVYIIRAVDLENPASEPAIPARSGITIGYWPTAAVFKIVGGTTVGTYELEQVWLDDDELEAFVIPVYNLLASNLPYDFYVAVREKNGDFIVQAGGGGLSVKFFSLQEDAATTRREIYAFELNDDGSFESVYTPIYDRFNWLAVARANQQIMAIYDAAKSRWTYVPGSCIIYNSANNQNAAITSTYTPVGSTTSQDAPDGTVSSSYTHTITTAFLAAQPTTTGLPPGLSVTSWDGANLVISGTPTTAGIYYVKLVGTASGGGTPGVRTRIVKIVINA